MHLGLIHSLENFFCRIWQLVIYKNIFNGLHTSNVYFPSCFSSPFHHCCPMALMWSQGSMLVTLEALNFIYHDSPALLKKMEITNLRWAYCKGDNYLINIKTDVLFHILICTRFYDLFCHQSPKEAISIDFCAWPTRWWLCDKSRGGSFICCTQDLQYYYNSLISTGAVN